MIKHRVLLIVVLLGLGAWTGYAQGQRTSPTSPTSPTRQIWEYRIIETATVEGYTPVADIQRLLNQGGAEGWELIRVSDTRYYFKRPK